MKLVFFFIAASTLFTAAAILMQPGQGSSVVSYPDHIPNVAFRDKKMYGNDRKVAKDMIINHYNGLEPWNDHKAARLAFSQTGWRDGMRLDDAHKQYLDFSYHRGDTSDSAKIGQTVELSRDRPPPEPRFSQSVLKGHKPEITKEIYKKYIALPPDQASRVRAMKVHGDWGAGSGLREETKFTYHHDLKPTPYNTIGDPVTIQRPMSFLVDSAVPEKEVPAITKRVRAEHEQLDENHPLKKANYGVVTQGLHTDAEGNQVMVGATLYKVKDKLSLANNHDENFKRIGDFDVPLGRGRLGLERPRASGPSASSTTKD